MRLLNEIECKRAMEKGEFELSEFAAGSGSGAVILTQSWCPQWKAMKNYLPELEKRHNNLKILYIEYDQLPFFEEFMTFKENILQNREIPFVLFYKDGKCSSTSNYLSLEGFLQRLG